MEWARLNIFQRLTRKWDAIHPYNAAQAMRLAGRAPHVDQLSEAWHETQRELGLGRVRFAGDWFRHERLSGELAPREPVLQVPPDTSFDRFITCELNRPFDDATPIRPFVLDGPADSHRLGVVYHHWIADSASIRIVLREWFRRLHDPARARRNPLRFGRDGYWNTFGPRRGRWELLDGALAAARWSLRLRQARRIEVREFDRFATSFSLHDMPEGIVDRLLPIARRAGASLNDLFLATLAQVCDALVPVKRTPRRFDLALGTIVDLRGQADDEFREAFGLFLGFTSVICRCDRTRDLHELLRRTARQSAHHRRVATAQSSMIRMSIALLAHRLYRPRALLNWYRKRIPLAGGISNVNLNRDWPAEYHPSPLLDYIRVSPCGPMMPLVFTPTTLGERMNFGLTCRDSVIPPDRASQIAATFRSRLVELAHS